MDQRLVVRRVLRCETGLVDVCMPLQAFEWYLRSSEGREIPLRLELARPLTVGRELTSDVPLLDAGVSRHHATLVLEEDGLWIEDLHSQNGTYVNAKRIRRARVEAGDILTFGRVHLTLLRRERAPAAERLARMPGEKLARIVSAVRQVWADPDPLAALGRILPELAASVGAERAALLWEAEPGLRLRTVATRPVEGFQGLEALRESAHASAALRGLTPQVVQGPLRPRAAGPAVLAPLGTRPGWRGLFYFERTQGALEFDAGDLEFLQAFAWLAGPRLEERAGPRESSPVRNPLPALAARQRTPAFQLGTRFGHGEEATENILEELEQRADALRGELHELAGGRHDVPRDTLGAEAFLRLAGKLRLLTLEVRAFHVLARRERPSLQLVDFAWVLRRAMERTEMTREARTVHSDPSFVVVAPTEPLILTTELLLAAAVVIAGPHGDIACTLRQAPRHARLGIEIRCEGQAGSDLETAIDLARKMAAEYLGGKVRVESAGESPGTIVLELPTGLGAVEETVTL